MRVFLESNDRCCVIDHPGGQVAMRVNLQSDRNIFADNSPDMLQHVSLTIRVAIGNHGAVHAQRHSIHR